MGKVVDADLKGEGKLHVNTSVFPVALTGHLQAATYAMAEQAAEIIYSSRAR